MAVKSTTHRVLRGGILVLVVIAVFAGGWVAARRTVSPAQRDAQARPPTANPITETVTSGSLVDQVSGSGTVSFAASSAIVMAAVPANAVVTAAPFGASGTLKDGVQLTEINGRPLFVCAGPFQFYRDLAPADSGPDVAQLQKCLMARGLAVLSDEQRARTYGVSTAAAVTAWYGRAGYPAPASVALSEIVSLPALPVQVTGVVGVGAVLTATSAVATTVSGGLTATIQIDVASAARVPQNAEVVVTASPGGQTLAAHVRALHDPTDPAGMETVDLAFVTPPDASLVGTHIVGVVTISVVANSSLILPARAVVHSSDGSDRVLVSHAGAPATSVRVTVLGTLAGRSAVKPEGEGALAAGDTVQVG